jgi:hypothetical protein
MVQRRRKDYWKVPLFEAKSNQSETIHHLTVLALIIAGICTMVQFQINLILCPENPLQQVRCPRQRVFANFLLLL